MISTSLRLSVSVLVLRFLLSRKGNHNKQRYATEFPDDVMACLLRHHGGAFDPSLATPSPVTAHHWHGTPGSSSGRRSASSGSWGWSAQLAIRAGRSLMQVNPYQRPLGMRSLL